MLFFLKAKGPIRVPLLQLHFQLRASPSCRIFYALGKSVLGYSKLWLTTQANTVNARIQRTPRTRIKGRDALLHVCLNEPVFWGQENNRYLNKYPILEILAGRG